MTKHSEPQAIAAANLITAEGVIAKPLIFVEDGRVLRLTTQAESEAPSNTLWLDDVTLSPGFLDVHIHGAGGHDVMEGTDEALHTVATMLAHYGTTRYLATTVTATLDRTLFALDAIAGQVGVARDDAAMPIGIHLEGPFLSHEKRGVHTLALLQEPSIELFERFWQASRGTIQLLTIAPELPGALELIKHAAALDVRVTLGHSNAVAAEARVGVAAGAVSATHTFNAMRGLTQREPGMLGVVLDDEALYADLICDGIHTTPEAVRLWYRMKGAERAILITDGMAATGMPEGEYKLGEMNVTVRNRTALSGGVLAGSVLTMDEAVANVQEFTGVDLATAARLASRNPARMLGLQADVAAGEFADFNLFDKAGRRTGTILRGRLLSN